MPHQEIPCFVPPKERLDTVCVSTSPQALNEEFLGPNEEALGKGMEGKATGLTDCSSTQDPVITKVSSQDLNTNDTTITEVHSTKPQGSSFSLQWKHLTVPLF